MLLFSGVPDDSEDHTPMEQYGAEALYSAVKSLMDAIRTENTAAQHDVAERTVQIAKC